MPWPPGEFSQIAIIPPGARMCLIVQYPRRLMDQNNLPPSIGHSVSSLLS